jgi:ABC-type transporter Mla maintaining outer membrane lipid asymmetry ATPase subunit MlaF
VLGLSGAGKTVLLKHLIGLIRPDKGRVVIDGVDIDSLSEDQLLKVRCNMGYLFQEGLCTILWMFMIMWLFLCVNIPSLNLRGGCACA